MSTEHDRWRFVYGHAAWLALERVGANEQEASQVATDEFQSFKTWVEQWAERALEIHRMRRQAAK